MSTDNVPSIMGNLGLDSYGNAGSPMPAGPTGQASQTGFQGLGAGMSDQKKQMLLKMLMGGIGAGAIPSSGSQLPQINGAIGGGVAGAI